MDISKNKKPIIHGNTHKIKTKQKGFSFYFILIEKKMLLCEGNEKEKKIVFFPKFIHKIFAKAF